MDELLALKITCMYEIIKFDISVAIKKKKSLGL